MATMSLFTRMRSSRLTLASVMAQRSGRAMLRRMAKLRSAAMADVGTADHHHSAMADKDSQMTR